MWPAGFLDRDARRADPAGPGFELYGRERSAPCPDVVVVHGSREFANASNHRRVRDSGAAVAHATEPAAGRPTPRTAGIYETAAPQRPLLLHPLQILRQRQHIPGPPAAGPGHAVKAPAAPALRP
jgi:hypothetical protein